MCNKEVMGVSFSVVGHYPMCFVYTWLSPSDWELTEGRAVSLPSHQELPDSTDRALLSFNTFPSASGTGLSCSKA